LYFYVGKYLPHKNPDFIIELAKRVRDAIPVGLGISTPEKWATHDQMEVYINEFLPGHSLAAHFDHRTTYEELIVGISLNSDSQITFTKGKESQKVSLPRRSLYVMYGPSRNQWKHAIEKEDVKGRRVSITFRTIN
jgi:alkylated DNA repair dioxygenase AlkB